MLLIIVLYCFLFVQMAYYCLEMVSKMFGIFGNCQISVKCWTLDPLFYVELLYTIQEKYRIILNNIMFVDLTILELKKLKMLETAGVETF